MAVPRSALRFAAARQRPGGPSGVPAPSPIAEERVPTAARPPRVRPGWRSSVIAGRPQAPRACHQRRTRAPRGARGAAPPDRLLARPAIGAPSTTISAATHRPKPEPASGGASATDGRHGWTQRRQHRLHARTQQTSPSAACSSIVLPGVTSTSVGVSTLTAPHPFTSTMISYSSPSSSASTTRPENVRPGPPDSGHGWRIWRRTTKGHHGEGRSPPREAPIDVPSLNGGGHAAAHCGRQCPRCAEPAAGPPGRPPPAGQSRGLQPVPVNSHSVRRQSSLPESA